jgi:PAS domain S-box-containing protein
VTLRQKTLVILGAAFIGLLAVVYLTASTALLRGFARLEEDSVRRSVDAVLKAIGDETAAVDAAALHWEGSATAAGEAAGSVAPPSRVESVGDGVDFVALVDAAGRVTIAASRDASAVASASLANDLELVVTGKGALARSGADGRSRGGIVVLRSGAALVSARSFPASGRPGAATATVVAGRFVDAARLGGEARTSLSVRLWDESDLPTDFAAARTALASGDRTVVRPLAEGWIAGYHVSDGAGGRPALILRVDAPRSIFMQGRASLTYLMVSLLLVAVVFAAVPFVLLERTVLRRLAWLAGGVAGIGASRSFASRLPVEGSDELAALAARINEMLAALERAQGERGESEARYRAVFEQAGDGIVLFDADSGRVLDANRTAQRMLGFGPGEVLDRSAFELVAGDAAAVATHIDNVKRDRRVYAGEQRFRRKDGSELRGEVASSLVALRGRDVICSVVRDTSERHQLEQRMRQSQKLEAVGRLAAGVAHDFNNLLQSVVSAVGVLRARGENAEARAQATATLDSQVASGAALTRQLLLIARQEAYAPAALDLNAVVREISNFLRRVVRENIRFEVKLSPDPLPARADRARLEQSLVNLVANASDAMPHGGKVTITTGREGGAVWYAVGDGGPGMAPEVRERAFEPFFTTRTDGQHAGLGLTVVQGIVEEHGGSITVASGPGAGTTFRIMLPAAAPTEAASSAGAAAAVAETPVAGGRILLVEDGEETRRGLCDMLSLLGYDVVSAASGEEAAARSDLADVDLLLTDYMLPGIDGAELARTLLDRRAQLRVIVMSGYAAEDAIRARVGAAPMRFLPKPFGMETLAREVSAALGRQP